MFEYGACVNYLFPLLTVVFPSYRSTWAAQALVWEATGDDEMRVIAREKQSRCLQVDGQWLLKGERFIDVVQGIKVHYSSTCPARLVTAAVSRHVGMSEQSEFTLLFVT
jgi:hypothetical protein